MTGRTLAAHAALEVSALDPAEAPRARRAGRRGGRLRTVATAVVLLFVFLPVLVVIGISADSSSVYRFPPTHPSVHWYESFFTTRSMLHALVDVSVPLGLTVSVIALAVGTLAALGLTMVSETAKQRLELLFATPLIFPQILLAVGLFLLFIRTGLGTGMPALVLANVVISTPFVVRTVLSGLEHLDGRLIESARNLGASPLQAFRLVTLPLLRSSMVSGALLAFIVAFSDVNMALFLSSAGATPLTLEILTQTQYASDPTIAAAAVVQLVVTCLLLVITQRLLGRLRL